MKSLVLHIRCMHLEVPMRQRPKIMCRKARCVVPGHDGMPLHDHVEPLLMHDSIQGHQYASLRLCEQHIAPPLDGADERWLRSFGQYFLFLRWNLCLVLGCLFDRRQHHGIRFVRGPFL